MLPIPPRPSDWTKMSSLDQNNWVSQYVTSYAQYAQAKWQREFHAVCRELHPHVQTQAQTIADWFEPSYPVCPRNFAPTVTTRLDERQRQFWDDRYYDIIRAFKARPSLNYRYLITFTLDRKLLKASTLDQRQFDSIIRRQLERKIFITARYSIEHIDRNMHAHALVEATHNVTKTNFAPYLRDYGSIDIRLVKVDNGIDDYIGKENIVFQKIFPEGNPELPPQWLSVELKVSAAPPPSAAPSAEPLASPPLSPRAPSLASEASPSSFSRTSSD